MQAARLAWSEAQPTMDVEKLVFIDETWAATNMTRSYGRAPKGCRCVDSAPLGDWQTTTFIAGLRHHQLTAPMVIDGPMDGELFLAWIEQFLCPTLQPGDIIILDNLSSHKVEGGRARRMRALPHFHAPDDPQVVRDPASAISRPKGSSMGVSAICN